MSYLNLAYLAEFAVAFNLAFGEWKHEKIAQEMEGRLESLDKDCEGPLVEFLESINEKNVQNHQSEFSKQRLTWKAMSVNRLDDLRRHRLKPVAGSKRYNPFRQFFERALLFATSPQKLWGNNGRHAKRSVFRDVLTGLPMGLLASWVYSKTLMWKHPPCLSSLITWTLLVAISIVLTLNTVDSGEFSLHASLLVNTVSLSFPIPCFPYLFASIGALAGLLAPRPLSAAGSYLIGRYPPVPRGRYYHFVLVCLVTAILIFITLLDSNWVTSNFEVIPKEALWMFLFGFLLVATIMPVLLFTGHLFLETSIDHWTKWMEDLAKEVADQRITEVAR